MSYCDLIKQEGEYTYSANIQFDIESDTKLLRFIPNETTIKLLKDYFTDMVRAKSFNHARILYGSYGTGKSHMLTVLSQLLEKKYTDGVAFSAFIDRIRVLDSSLANDIEAYVNDKSRKPLLVVPIVFDFEDFDRCIYFSLKKKLDAMGISIQYKTFYDQAATLIEQWKSSEDSSGRLIQVCSEARIDLQQLEKQLGAFDPSAELAFEKLFGAMTFGVKYIYEVSNLSDTLNQAHKVLSKKYSGIVFIFDEFGRYLEDNIKKIKVKSVQDLAEYCDHCEGNNHILLVSHKEISQYTQHYGKTLAAEWKKVEGRYKADSINSKQDQCLSLIRSVLIKNEPVWDAFRSKYTAELNRIYSDAMDFKGFLVNTSSDENPFEGGFPLHPIALFALDRLSKKVAQNDRTFFTFLAGKDDGSLYRFLIKTELDGFHFVGIDAIFDYFEPSIKAVQSDESYEWYKNYLGALSKNQSDGFDESPEVSILKVIATIGIINDPGALSANKKTILCTIDFPEAVLENALEALCEKKIIKYSGVYNRYDFFDASIYDVDGMIEEECLRINDETAIKTLNDHFVNFVLYPHKYNRVYKISRVFVPIFTSPDVLSKRATLSKLGTNYDGILLMVMGNSDISEEHAIEYSRINGQTVIWVNNDSAALMKAVRKYIAAKYLETQKSKYMEKDPAFEKELLYNIQEIEAVIFSLIDEWKAFKYEDGFISCGGELHNSVKTLEQVSELASGLMFEVFPNTMLVNNELINKNIVSGSIATAKRNVLRAIITDGQPQEYYGLPYLSPEYIAVRSVLAKNGFIITNDIEDLNRVMDNTKPQEKVRAYINSVIERAKKGSVEFSEIYATLKQAPFGLRDGYLSLIFACVLVPHKKALIISSHGSEQELSAELFEEIVRRPNDFSFTVADWSKEQLEYMDRLEQQFDKFIDSSALSKNRLKAIYDGMISHYKSAPKFSRSTQIFVSDQTKKYRQLMERTYASYSTFFFAKLKGLTGDFTATLEYIALSKGELETTLDKLKVTIKRVICEMCNVDVEATLGTSLQRLYSSEWSAKRKKSFDYYTNAFLEYTSTVSSQSTDDEILAKLAKSLTGIELSYWSDKHVEEFENRLSEIKKKLDAYVVSDDLKGSETRMTLTTASGETKEIVFDSTALSNLGITVKNKISSTFGNFGLSISYDDKVQILLSLLNDLMEGK